jgi:MFS family permease
MSRFHWRVLVILMIAEIVSAFESSMVLAGLSAWQRETGDPVMVGWIISSYLLVSSASAALLGRLGDILGRKQVLVFCIMCTALGSIISMLAPNIEILILGRAIQGVAGAIMPLCYGLVQAHLPADRIPFGVSLIVATAATASAVGLLLGGVLTDAFGPQAIFTASAAVAILILPVIQFGLPNSPTIRLPANFDWLGGVLFAPGVAALLYGMSSLRQGGPAVYLPLIAGSLLLIWWWRHEWRHEAPLLDVRLLANRNCILANLAMLMAALGVMQVTQVTSQLIQQPTATGTGLGESATFLGAIKLPTVMIGVLGSLAAGWLIPRHGQRAPILAGAILIVINTAMIAFNQTSLLLILLMICATSIGVNLAYAAIPTIIIAAAPDDRVGEATGMMAVFRAVGQALGAQTIAVLMSLSIVTLPEGGTFTSADGYMLAFLFIAATGIALLFVAIGLRLSGRTPVKAQA